MSRCAVFLAVTLAAGAAWQGCTTDPPTQRAGTGGPRIVRSTMALRPQTRAAVEDAREESRIRAYTEYATGLSFEEREDPSSALEHFSASALADPSFEPLVIETARRHLQRKQPDRAVALLKPSAGLPDASPVVLSWLGLAHAQAGQTDLAIDANRLALKKAPGFLMAYQNLFHLYVQGRRYPEARNTLAEGAKAGGTDAAFCVELAGLSAQLARFLPDETAALNQQQRTFLDRALALKPENILLVERLADSLARFPDTTPQVEGLYQKVLSRFPQALPVREKLLRLYLKAGRKDAALAQLESIRREQPTNPATYYLLGSLAYEEKQYDLATEHFATAIRLDPNFEPVYYELAGLHITRQKPQDALDLLAKARTRFKARFLLEYYAGLAHGAQKNYQEAIKNYIAAEVFAKASEPERLTHIFYFQYGAAHERVGEFAEAEKFFRRALELNPKFPEALNYLGYMWAERSVNLPEARALIEQALALEPKNGAFLDSMAWVLFQLGQPAQALPWMEQSLSQTEEPDATLFDHLGDILAALNRHDEARKAWTRSLELEPADKVRRKLDGPR